MAAVTLTAKTVEALKPDPAKRIEVGDKATTGLVLIVQPSGTKSWVFVYKRAGKRGKVALGAWPAMSLSDARKAAAEARGRLDEGGDPVAEAKAAKAEAKARAAGVALADRDRFDVVLAEYGRRKAAAMKSGDGVMWSLRKYVLPRWADRDVTTLERRDVIELLDTLVDDGQTVGANRVLAHVRAMFAWCVDRGILPINPAAGLKPPHKEKARDRVLSDDEIRWFWTATGDMPQPFGALLRTLLLTGQRRGEVAGMTRDEIAAGDTWTLAADRVKNSRPHSVPLSAAARAAIAAAPVTDAGDGDGDGSTYVFSTNGTRPISGFNHVHRLLTAAMAKAAEKEAGKPVEIVPFVLHDLRRCFATLAARTGAPVHVVEKLLNHVSGSVSGVAAVYNRHSYQDEMRQTAEAVATLIERIASGKEADVVEMAARRTP